MKICVYLYYHRLQLYMSISLNVIYSVGRNDCSD